MAINCGRRFVFINKFTYIYTGALLRARGADGGRETKPNGKMKHEEFVVVAEYVTLTEAEMAKSFLESAGIPAQIRNEYMTSLAAGPRPLRLVVAAGDALEARMMLERR